jgi:hypothetical protein
MSQLLGPYRDLVPEAYESCWTAPANIAFVKYWGKKGHQLPANPSLSMTLSECVTKTKTTFSPSSGLSVELNLEGKSQIAFAQKIKKYLESLQTELPWFNNVAVKIETSNTFPHGTGIASSASGLAAFALTLADYLRSLKNDSDEGLFLKRASYLSRLASGSACRSLYGGYTTWGESFLAGSSDKYATTFMVHPDLKDLIKKIVIMGGGHKFGNITPAAEFNIFADPEAAKIVFEFGVELVMVGLDVTMADGLTRTQVSNLFTHHNDTTRIIEHILLDMVNGEGSAYKPWAYIHDAMALMYLLYDDLLEGDYYHVDLETKGLLTYGKTVVDYYHTHKKNKNAWVAFHVNSERFHQALKERLSIYEKR